MLFYLSLVHTLMAEIEEGSDDKSKEYNNVVNSFTNRAPNKRKIKPVESELVQFAFGDAETDDEDEDYTVGDMNYISDDDRASSGGKFFMGKPYLIYALHHSF